MIIFFKVNVTLSGIITQLYNIWDVTALLTLFDINIYYACVIII